MIFLGHDKVNEMDEMMTLSAQMEQDVSPVILINKFNVKPEDVDQLLKAWAAYAAYFKQQDSFPHSCIMV
jgi:hypothetical protein